MRASRLGAKSPGYLKGLKGGEYIAAYERQQDGQIHCRPSQERQA